MPARRSARCPSRPRSASLRTGATYHYRLVASSDAGTSRSPDQTVALVSVPSVVTNPAGSIGTSTARLNGSVNPAGQSTTYYFEYGTTTELRVEDGRRERRLVELGAERLRVDLGPRPRDDVPLPPRRLERIRDDARRRSELRHLRTADRPDGLGLERDDLNGATVTGAVNPQGRSTNWYFDYGTTTTYGSKTAVKNAGSGYHGRRPRPST